jgi:hypothetical protein
MFKWIAGLFIVVILSGSMVNFLLSSPDRVIEEVWTDKDEVQCGATFCPMDSTDTLGMQSNRWPVLWVRYINDSIVDSIYGNVVAIRSYAYNKWQEAYGLDVDVYGNGAYATDLYSESDGGGHARLIYGTARNTLTGSAEGVHVTAYSGSGTSHGGYFSAVCSSSANDGIGVYGRGENKFSRDAYGGYFFTATTGTGVHYGAYAESDSFGIWAKTTSPTKNYAGYFDGNVYIKNSLGVQALTPDERFHVGIPINTFDFIKIGPDGQDYGVYIGNGTSSGFRPTVFGGPYDGDDYLHFEGAIESADDTGSTPVIVMSTHTDFPMKILNRSLFQLRNFQDTCITVDKDCNTEFKGDVTADSFKFSSSITRYYTLHASAFSANQEIVRVTYGIAGAYLKDSTGLLLATVNLPDGAVVTEVKWYIYDNAMQDITCYLKYVALLTGTALDMASVTSAGTPGNTTLTDNTIANPTIDNTTFSYIIGAWLDTGDANHIFRNARIEYTIDKPLP